MAKTNTYRILIWIIAILLATNISMGISFVYHKRHDKKMIKQPEKTTNEVPAQRRTRYFRENLNLQSEQMDEFRELNRSFNQNAWQINYQLEQLRIDMISELGNEIPDLVKLDSISQQIGELHTDLKEVTITYYLNMKERCNEEQRAKLNDIFMSMLKQNEDVKLPRNGRNRNNRN